jgi:OOP family OmpA-OmpF porin
VKKSILISMASVFAAVIFMGCACNQPSLLQSGFKPSEFQAEAYQPRVNNFMILLDASASMSYCYQDSNRMNTAKAIVDNMNRSIPAIPIQGALRSFGHSPAVSMEKTALMYGLTPYTVSGLDSGLDKISAPGGNSPLAAALDAAGEDLAAADGRIALIIVSDGDAMGPETFASAEKLVDRFRERLCVYTIHVGDNAAGGATLDKIARTAGCGGARNDRELNSSTAMAAFVETVFLEKRRDGDGDGVYDDADACSNTPAGTRVDVRGCPLDSDNDGVPDALDACPDTPAYLLVDGSGCPLDTDKDGVPDHMDKCPNTRSGAAINAQGCPLDSDGDGIADYMDNCPNTPKGSQVDYAGCPYVKASASAQVTDAGTWLYEGVQFGTGSAEINAESYAVLDEIADLLTSNPGLKVEIQGHTDSAGSRELNVRLSEERAKSVEAYLMQKGLSSDQLTVKGYGPDRPIASNDSAAGRAKNRRVELNPIQ